LTGSFEEAELPGNYDLIYSATAFHWIDPEVAYKKSAELLKAGGCLAIIHTEHVSDEAGDAFFAASHAVYRKYEKHDNTAWLPHEHDLQPRLFDEDLFVLDSFTTFRMPITYTADDFAGLVGTYSPTLALPPQDRAGLLADIKELINTKFNGKIVRQFAMTLTILRKR
jgi:SAM-dependent methyltransferase